MSKEEKLVERFLSIPADFTWGELVKVLGYYGYAAFSKGKTAGSRRKFADHEKNIILLHEPHPAKVVKKYAIRQVIEHLREKRKINDE